MKIAALYSFKGGENVVPTQYPHAWADILAVLADVDGTQCRTKQSREKTKQGRMLYSPKALNEAISTQFRTKAWQTERVQCDYSKAEYLPGFEPLGAVRGAFREIDFVKDGLGVEVQSGKYAFMAYNVCAKMTIFRNLGVIQAGVEIVPIKALAESMSSGVSYFEQIVWDLRTRGEADIDIPVLIVGITV